MKKFMCALLSFVLVVICGCFVTRLWFDIVEMQEEPEELIPVYTYSHSAIGAVILESNTSTGEVKYTPVCPRCGNYGYDYSLYESDIYTATITSYNEEKREQSTCFYCGDMWHYGITVTIHTHYQCQ